MARWFVPTPSPYRPHPATWQQPLHLHLAPMWRELTRTLGELHGRVVDVGCGNKPYRALLGPDVTAYVGVDRAGTACADVAGDAHALPFADKSFDAAVSFQVLEHLERPAEGLAEMSRVVVPGGTVLFTVPGVWPDHEIPHDYWRFTRYGLAAMMRSTGFVHTELVPLGGFWSALGQMAVLELQRGTVGRALVPLVNLAAARADRTARQTLVLNWLVRARRPP